MGPNLKEDNQSPLLVPRMTVVSAMIRKRLVLLLTAFLWNFRPINAACQACVLLPHHQHHRRSTAAFFGRVSAVVQQATGYATWKQIAAHKLSRNVATKPVLAATVVGVTCVVPALAVRRRRVVRPIMSSSERDQVKEGEEGPTESDESGSDTKPVESSDAVSTSMISALGFYKSFISPLLPPACRFVPTCSQYGVQAIQKFGPGKGSILIAWRLMRCSPFGGKGFDPPQWPPVSYTHGSW